MKTAPLTRLDLDSMGCGVPGCTHAMHESMFVHSRCHPTAGTRVEYRRPEGVLRIRCRKCEAHIIDVLVATALS